MLNERLLALRPDFINIHNLHSADWFPDLFRVCALHAPTVCTLHDMWSFTGRCAYSYECRKFLTGCDATCPTPQEYPARLPQRIAGDWEQRRHLLENEARLWAVAPSQWLAQEARAGLWKNRLLEVIPYGLPLDVYRPVDRILARHALGIDSTGPVILVVAQNLSERRKGGSFLIGALQKLPIRPLSLLTMGIEPLPVPGEGIQVHSLGYVTHDRMKVLAYSAADLLVHPAPVDNLPNVVLEAIACGTPVVGFPIGGMPDMVRAGETGWLASALNSEALADALAQACGELKRGRDLRDSCRVIAEREYNPALQALRYSNLFGSLPINPSGG
jgi:Glycosyltransferase